ncbi:hypothetical protein D3C80_980770 [compost metagenome]
MDAMGQVEVDVIVQVGLEEREGLVEVETQFRSADFAKFCHRPQPPKLEFGKHP